MGVINQLITGGHHPEGALLNLDVGQNRRPLMGPQM